jgi:hypothetical protein
MCKALKMLIAQEIACPFRNTNFLYLIFNLGARRSVVG